jgi:hypothetical protein
VGFVLMMAGEAGNFLAYGFAPASIVSPLGVVALVSNCLIAPFMLKEKFRKRDFCGVVVAIAGAVTIVLSAKTSETKIGPDLLWKMITRWQFELYLGLTVALILVLMWVSERYGSKSIFIDLGLVGLFGEYLDVATMNRLVLRYPRRMHCSVNQRCCFIAFLQAVACHHLLDHICSGRCPYLHCIDANSIHQSCPPTIRFY